MTAELTLHDLSRVRIRTRTIEIACGTGIGPNPLAAFDSALVATGIANYNLLRLSSVIPAHTRVRPVVGPVSPISGEWGDRLYVVMAEARVTEPGAEAWAGIGWVQDETGKGLFVEHEGYDETSVRNDILDSLGSLVASRPGESFGEPRLMVHGARCEDMPTCALAVAVYETAAWSIDMSGRN